MDGYGYGTGAEKLVGKMVHLHLATASAYAKPRTMGRLEAVGTMGITVCFGDGDVFFVWKDILRLMEATPEREDRLGAPEESADARELSTLRGMWGADHAQA
jgi:hypothetical protein